MVIVNYQVSMLGIVTTVKLFNILFKGNQQKSQSGVHVAVGFVVAIATDTNMTNFTH